MERILSDNLENLDVALEETLKDFSLDVHHLMVSVGGKTPQASDFNKLGKLLDITLVKFKEALIEYLDELENDIGRN